MSKQITIGKTYAKRSAITGKSRKLRAVAERGQRIVCIADDNGRTLIVSRTRLHRDSMVATDQQTFAPSDELAARLDQLLSKLEKEENE